MSDPGPAQLDLIRRYARTMRAMHADAMAARGPRIGAREARDRGAAADPLGKTVRVMTGRQPGNGSDVAGPGGVPTLPAS
jgi:hypothetical protein